MGKLLKSRRWWVGDLTANIPGNLITVFQKSKEFILFRKIEVLPLIKNIENTNTFGPFRNRVMTVNVVD